ncbi:MAG TPA: glycosyltransferase family 87 protein [Acidobacteriaceae bacterium]|nr:glycosyltransferase family 87 protein [Acidobacteriaceae bacterium]
MSSAQPNALKASPPSRPTPGAIILFLVFSFITLTIGIMALPRAGRLYDFRAFYGAGWLLLHNPHQLFSLSLQETVQNAIVCPMWRGVPFYHPAYEALLYAPLTLLSYRHAYIVFAVLNLLLLALCYTLAPRSADPRIARIPRPLLFSLCFPAFMGIAEGQDSIVFFLLICLLWRALASTRDRTAGILLALALFKVQIALALLVFLAIYLPTPRRVRLLLSFLPSAAAVALTCLLITGSRGMAAWFRLIASSSVASHLDHHAQSIIAVYPRAMPTLNGLLYVCGARLLPARASLALDLLLSAIVFALAVYLCRTASSLAVAFCATLAAAILLAPHLFLYDYVLLLLPILLLTQPHQPLLTALFYVLNYALFAIGGIDWFAFMALVPVAFLTSLLLTERSHRLHHPVPEKVTPHPLTAL